MERTLVKDLQKHIGEEVSIDAVVDVVRLQGKVAFFDFRDRSSIIQGVVFGKPELLETAKEVTEESSLLITGIVNQRPEKMINDKVENGDIELEITDLKTLGKAEALPFDKEAELNLDTLLDNRPLTLRRKRERAIFKIQTTIVQAYRSFLVEEGFVEFQAPKLVGGDAEGGAEVFKVDYFYDQKAYLATSPQLYKQIMVGVFERVFSTGSTFRAEKSATTRHMSEITMLDFEMGFIENYQDVMDLVTKLMRYITKSVSESCGDELNLLGVDAALAPEIFPTFTLREAQNLIKKETGIDKTDEPDLEPEDERWLCEYTAKELGSDFVFITQFPTSKRPFYTYLNQEDESYTDSFDLLFRGLEMCSGGQREHNYSKLTERMKEKGLDPEKFEFYLQAFKYGLPPHGGIGMGLERLTMKYCGLDSVKEATLFPRDMNRIDTLLEKNKDNDKEIK